MVEILVVGLVTAAIIWISSKLYNEWDTRQRSRRYEERRRREIRQKLINLGSAALTTFETMLTQLVEAEKVLDKAEVDFKNNVVAPFWDSVEKATICIGRFDNNVRSIMTASKKHVDIAKTYGPAPPRFPISMESVQGMLAANITTNRMVALVRNAQYNFQFALIYEQRKTNKILGVGLQNLAQAIDGLGEQIASSLDGLSNQISEMSSAVGDIGEEAENQADRHDKALKMFDNIKSRHVPEPH